MFGAQGNACATERSNLIKRAAGRSARRRRAFAAAIETLETRLHLTTVFTTGAATAVTTTGATLNATVNPQGATATPTFQYSTTPTFTPSIATQIGGTNFNGPLGVAVDSFGNVLVADTGNNALATISNGNTSSTSPFNAPAGVAVDSSGDIFIADSGNNLVREIPSGQSIKNIGSGFAHPQGVAVDGSGDVFVADTSNGVVKEIVNGSNTINTIGTGFTSPTGVAVDGAGDVYVADPGNHAVYKVVAGGGGTMAVGSGFNYPSGVAVDGAGDVFVADQLTNKVTEILAGGALVTIGSGFSGPAGVAVDSAGDVFVAQYQSSQVTEVSPPTIIATPPTVTASTATAISGTVSGLTANTLYYYRPLSTVGGTAIGAIGSFLTTPPPTVVSGAATGISGSGATLNASVDSAGSATNLRFQYSTDPSFTPTVATQLGSGFSKQGYLAADALGDVFVADSLNNAVEKILPTGAVVNIGSGFSQPRGVAVDAGGDVFVTDYGNAAVKEVMSDGVTINTLAPSFVFSSPTGIAVDTVGDVYVTDPGNQAVYKILPNGAVSTIGYGITAPQGIAVDAAGDVFVTSSVNVYEIFPTGQTSILHQAGLPAGIAVDGAGDVFYADFNQETVNEFPPFGAVKTISMGFTGPKGLAMDAAGDLFVGDFTTGMVSELSPPTITASPAQLTTAGATPASGTLTGLASNTLFYDRPVASSAGGTIVGSAGSFFTQPSPTVVTEAPTSVSPSGATFNATVNPQGLSTTTSFQYSTDSTFTPSVISTIGSGFSNPTGVAVDAAGDVFFADSGHSSVKEILPSGTVQTIASGFNYVLGVAVDAGGDVFVSDKGNNNVDEIPFGGTLKILGNVASAFNAPMGLAVDGAGDVFVANSLAGAVGEILPDGSIRTVASGFAGATQYVAVDSAGDVFATDSAGDVYKILPNGTFSNIASSDAIFIAAGVAVDAAGDVFVADTNYAVIKEILPNGDLKTFGSGFTTLTGAAVDAAGEVFVADSSTGKIFKIAPPTIPGSPASLSGSTATAVSAAANGLALGTYIYRAVAAEPGGIVAGLTQSFSIISAGTTTSTTTLAASAGTIVVGDPVTLTATVTAGATGTVTFFDGTTQLASPADIAGGQAVAVFAFGSAATHSITAHYSGDGTYAASVSSATPLVVVTVLPITATATSPDVTSNIAAETVTVVYTSGSAINNSTIGVGNISVTGPGGQSDYILGVTTIASNGGNTVTASYTVAPPMEAAWVSGTYQVAIKAGAVSDSTGVVTPAASSTFSSSLAAQDLLVPTLLPSGPATVVGGAPVKLKDTLTLTPAARGQTGLSGNAIVLLSPDENAADSVLTLGSTSPRHSFANGKAKGFNVKVPKSIPATIPAGVYHLLVKQTDTTGLVETYESYKTLTVVAPVVDLTGSFVKFPTAVSAGKKFPITFLVTNSASANVAATGTVTIDIDSSSDGKLSDAVVLTGIPKHINLKPGKSMKITVSETLNTSVYLVVNLDPANAVFPNDVNPANNSFATTSQIQG